MSERLTCPTALPTFPSMARGVAAVRSKTDEELAQIYRDEAPPRRDEAFRELAQRLRPHVLGYLRRCFHVDRVYSVTGCTGPEDFHCDVMFKALEKFAPSRNPGVTFKGFALGVILKRMVIDAARAHKCRPDTKYALLEEGDRSCRSSWEVLFARNEIHRLRELAAEAVKGLSERDARSLVLCDFYEVPQRELLQLFPGESAANLRKIAQRARKALQRKWMDLGGDIAAKVVQILAQGMEVEVERIRNGAARRALETWSAHGFSLADTANRLGLPEEKTRTLLLEAVDQVARHALRGVRRDDERERNEARTVRLVRVLLGFAPPEHAFDTLGSFLHRRLSADGRFDAACRALRLTPSELRRLLSDRLEVARDLRARLARFLRVPARFVEALPRVPPGADHGTRSFAEFDEERFLQRMRKWRST